MANNQRRMLYVKLWSSTQFNKLSDKGKLLFIGTISLADDDGILIANPSYLRGQIFPYDENITVTEVLQLRNDIAKYGLFEVYSVDDCEYIYHPKWLNYQIIRKDLYKKSTLPSRNETVTNSVQKRDTSKDKLSKDNTRDSKEPHNIKNNKKTMKKNSFNYSENKHSDSYEDEINIDTGEYIKPTSTKKYPNAKVVFDLFGKYPANWKMNTTQLKSAENLFTERGVDQIIKALNFLKENKDQAFCPEISSPYDLDSKWAKVISFKKKLQ